MRRARPTLRRRRGSAAGSGRGFSLIEVMVAVAILAVVTTMTWGSFSKTSSTKKAIEAGASRYRTVRIALDRMVRDITQAYLSQNEDTAQPERRTLFVGKNKFGVSELRFSYFGHQRLYQDTHECDTAQVGYFPMINRETGKTDLMRRETRRLQYLKLDDNPGETNVLCDDVIKLKFEYWDSRDKVWREEWDTTSADGQPYRLPTRVRITLTVKDERDKEIPFLTEARISVLEPLNSVPNDSTYAASSSSSNTQPSCGAAGQACCAAPAKPCANGNACGANGKC